jgi:hypothetical protein
VGRKGQNSERGTNLNDSEKNLEAYHNQEPPSQHWIKNQLSRVMSMLGYSTSSPSNVWNCRQPRHTYYFPKIKIIFTGIPKSGSSNWKEFLLRAEGALNISITPEEVDIVHLMFSNPFRLNYGENAILATQADRHDALSFVVVRNPWVRLVSGFQDKLVSLEAPKGRSPFDRLARRVVKDMNRVDGIKGGNERPTFDQFLRWFPDNLDRMNDHFTPQHLALCIPSATYDYMIPLEYSNILSENIVRHINTSAKLYGSYDHSEDPRVQSSALRAKEWLSRQDPQLIERIYKIFEADFALMNYSNFSHPDFPLPLHGHVDE